MRLYPLEYNLFARILQAIDIIELDKEDNLPDTNKYIKNTGYLM